MWLQRKWPLWRSGINHSRPPVVLIIWNLRRIWKISQLLRSWPNREWIQTKWVNLIISGHLSNNSHALQQCVILYCFFSGVNTVRWSYCVLCIHATSEMKQVSDLPAVSVISADGYFFWCHSSSDGTPSPNRYGYEIRQMLAIWTLSEIGSYKTIKCNPLKQWLQDFPPKILNMAQKQEEWVTFRWSLSV